MIFARYDNIWFVVISFFCLCIILFLYQRKYTNVLNILTSLRSQSLLIGYNHIKKLTKYIFFLLGFLCLGAALLRPQVDKEPMMIQEEGWNVIIALDISRSMQTQDMYGQTRLSKAKEKIKTFLEKLSCARVSLILFSSDAFVQCPLTADKEAFLLFLDHVDSESISSGSTALDRALLVAIDSLQTTKTKNNIVLLVTDGEDFSQNLHVAKQKALSNNIVVCALGIGSKEGGPIPIFAPDGTIKGYEKDNTDKIAISRLNEETLSLLTKELNGFYMRATEDEHDIKKITYFITSQEKNRFDNKEIMLKFDLYPFFLLGGFLCLIFEWIL